MYSALILRGTVFRTISLTNSINLDKPNGVLVNKKELNLALECQKDQQEDI